MEPTGENPDVRRTSLPVRLAAGTVAAVLTLAACGSDDGDDGVTSGSVPSSEPGDISATPGTAAGGSGALPGVDLGSAEVDPASDVPANPFPDLVIDDVRRGTKVNLRNLLPAENPVLLWLWAPH
jgi:hypothetical protein